MIVDTLFFFCLQQCDRLERKNHIQEAIDNVFLNFFALKQSMSAWKNLLQTHINVGISIWEAIF